MSCDCRCRLPEHDVINAYPKRDVIRFQSVVHRLLPALIMGSIAIVAGVLGFLLPETRGKKLPERVSNVSAKTDPAR